MTETSEQPSLIQLLMEKGYDEESATKCVADVLDARKILRERHLKNYLGKRMKGEFDGLLFEVIVKDVKIDNDGKVQFQVTPLNGSKSAWIKHLIA